MINEFDIGVRDADSEGLKKKYEHKIAILVDYIKKIKNNSDFFNYNLDNDILLN